MYAETLNDVLNHTVKLEEEPFTEEKDSNCILNGEENYDGYKCLPLQEEHKETVKRYRVFTIL